MAVLSIHARALVPGLTGDDFMRFAEAAMDMPWSDPAVAVDLNTGEVSVVAQVPYLFAAVRFMLRSLAVLPLAHGSRLVTVEVVEEDADGIPVLDMAASA